VAESLGLSRLKAQFDGAMAGLDGVEAKRLFGCDGYFVRGNIFGLVWKEGRLGLRVDDADAYAAIARTPGSEPWAMGGRVMQHWVLLPVAWHGRPAALRAWCRRAWAMAAAKPEKPAVTRRLGSVRTIRKAQFRRVARPQP
jgi:TfoX/Sxy family transcriptional regulator of competence genes